MHFWRLSLINGDTCSLVPVLTSLETSLIANCPCSTPRLTCHVTEFKPEKVKTSHETYLPTAQIQAPLKNDICLFLITHIQKRKASPDCTTQNTVNYNTTQGHRGVG
jgi:hypothetical protein